jgi:outer membrane receptor for monomeric catechols
MGVYFTRADILARRASRPSDMLRSTPGVTFVRTRSGQGIRFISSAGQRRECVPMIWVDGQRAPGLELDDLPVNDIEGIELYQGPSTTPMQFSQALSVTTCGTIVVWSRPPGL